MKRGICLILAAQLMLLAACGSDAGTGNETTSGSMNSGKSFLVYRSTKSKSQKINFQTKQF